ncbi:DUF2255 family protein [Streptomyces sp. NPDC020801]|uniref:DUF2255 family protein n=1 Tax=unclassified Streptomyces TaxID=2593676 RepID=UPI00378C518E
MPRPSAACRAASCWAPRPLLLARGPTPGYGEDRRSVLDDPAVTRIAEAHGKSPALWVVRTGDHVCVRSVKGVDGPWYRGTRSRNQGRITAGGVQADVAFREADPGEYAAVDAAYREKYGRYTSIVEHVLTEQARASTLRLEPR